MTIPYKRALIIGAGSGLSASLARQFAAAGLSVALAARSTDDLAELAEETGASRHRCDAGRREAIHALFAEVDEQGAPDVVVYNPSARVRGPITEADGAAADAAVQVTALGAFHSAQAAARRMVPTGHGRHLGWIIWSQLIFESLVSLDKLCQFEMNRDDLQDKN